MARSIEEIQADIARVKQRIASREQNQYRQPQSRAGWGSYIISGDRGMLDAYQNRENAWNTMMEQQMFQAEQNAKNRRLQEEQNALNRKNQLDVAKANKAASADDKRASAEDRLAKLKITKEQLKGQGHDTRDIDVDINRIITQYPDLAGDSTEAPFDPKGTAEYKLSKYKAYDASHNSVEELEEAMNEISDFDTPQAIELYVKLERERIKRDRWDKSDESLKREINAYNTRDGGLSQYLIGLNYTEKVVPGGYMLLDPKGKPVKKPKSKAQSGWKNVE